MAPPLVPSLLQALVVMNGESLVLHVGERPYVVADRGQIALAKAPLTSTTVRQVMDELLPANAEQAIEAAGATQFVISEHPLLVGERFSVVAARAGDDAWVEIRRVGGTEPVESPKPQREEYQPEPATVLPIERRLVRQQEVARPAASSCPTAEHLLRLARARGASTLYLRSGARPAVRVDGDIQELDGLPELSAGEVEALLLTLAPEPSAEALRGRIAGEWTSELEALGRVRCLAFRDSAGPGGVLRLIPTRVSTAEQLGVSPEILRLASGSDGLVLVAGPRSSGKRTLMSAFVEHIARARRVHIVTIEREVSIEHAALAGIVSQREAARLGEAPDIVRAALREDPDVLVIEDLGSAELVNLALEAAAPGRLVIGGCSARSASAAVDRLIDAVPPSARPGVQLAVAHTLRGVVAQTLLRRKSGGRIAARELLLNTPAVASLLAEGKTSQLPAMIASRDQGMTPMADVLAGLVLGGTVELAQAFEAAPDRVALRTVLERRGVDVSEIERLG